MLDAAQIRAQRDALEKAGIRHAVLEFEGGHRLDRETLQAVGR
jgi:hypothetical protein